MRTLNSMLKKAKDQKSIECVLTLVLPIMIKVTGMFVYIGTHRTGCYHGYYNGISKSSVENKS